MKNRTLKTVKTSSSLICLVFFSFIWPLITTNFVYDVIVSIRSAITSGDSGLLIITTIGGCILYTVPSFLMYIALDALYTEWHSFFKSHRVEREFFIVIFYGSLLLMTQMYYFYPIEPMTSFIGLIITLALVRFSTCKPDILFPKVFIALQVFLLVQWGNVIQGFTPFRIGSNDLFVSLKIASSYLDHLANINKIAFSFMLPLFLSSFMTAFIIKLYNQNLHVAEENYEKELAVKAMQKKIMTNRTYQEINALAHDLKTPLVTIQGLMSLLMLTKDTDKIEPYGQTVNDAIQKMSDMISSFLYGNIKELIRVDELLNYIRTQIPIEREDIEFTNSIADNLPPLYLNKIRMARALINLIENAILAPTDQLTKKILVKAYINCDKIIISITDNGIGIKDVDLEKIWTIGYSSKETSGLGLPFAKQTIIENNGQIELTSTYGRGTTAKIYFPIHTVNERGTTHDND